MAKKKKRILGTDLRLLAMCSLIKEEGDKIPYKHLYIIEYNKKKVNDYIYLKTCMN